MSDAIKFVASGRNYDDREYSIRKSPHQIAFGTLSAGDNVAFICLPHIISTEYRKT